MLALQPPFHVPPLPWHASSLRHRLLGMLPFIAASLNQPDYWDCTSTAQMELPCALGFVPKGCNPDTPSMNCVRRYPARCDVCTAYDAAPAWPDPPGCSQRRRRAPCFGVRQNRSAQISAQNVQVRACAICVFLSAAARSGPSADAAPVCPVLRDE